MRTDLTVLPQHNYLPNMLYNFTHNVHESFTPLMHQDQVTEKCFIELLGLMTQMSACHKDTCKAWPYLFMFLFCFGSVLLHLLQFPFGLLPLLCTTSKINMAETSMKQFARMQAI